MFTPMNYRGLLEAFLQAGYSFHLIGDDLHNRTHPYVLLRHDVDFSLSHAVTMAKMEADLGLRAAYFIQIASPCYNSLSKRASLAIAAILGFSHSVGLHFDFGRYTDDYPAAIRRELDLLETHYPGTQTSVVSLHRPRVFGHMFDAVSSGIRHTYERQYTEDIAYFSDSGGEWRLGHPLASPAFVERSSMQLLIHPLWWTTGDGTPLDKLAEFVARSELEKIDDLEQTAVSMPLDSLRDWQSRRLSL